MPRLITPCSGVGVAAPELEPKNPGACAILALVPRLRLSARALVAAAVGLVAADWAYRLAGDSFFPGGPLDEIAHLLTTLIVVCAFPARIRDRVLVPALVASVLIDLDHVPAQLGHDFLTRGTQRPYTHSLLSIAVVLGAAALWRSRRDVMLGIALGLAIHFWRDMSEADAGVALLWPWSDHSFTLSHAGYLVVMALFLAAGIGRRYVRLE
jgi:inner membrane protein